MKTLILDLNIQIQAATKTISKDLKSSERDFSSTLEAIKEKNQSQGPSNKGSKKDLNSHTVKYKDKIKADKEDEERDKRVIEIEEDVNIPIFYKNLFLITDSLNLEDEPNSLELETGPQTELVESVNVNDEEILFNTLLVDNEEFDLEKNKPVHEEEISNDPTDKVDFTGKDKSTIKTDFIQDSGKIQVNTMDLNPMEGNLLDKASVTDDTVKGYLLEPEENKSNWIQEPVQYKTDNPEIELVTDERNNIATKETDIKIDPQPILTANNEFISVKDNTIELDKADTIDKKDLINQIVQKIKLDFQSHKNEIRIKLKPEILGEMTMKIEVEKGSIVVRIMVENQRTKEIIEGNIIQLREEIKDTGLEIKTFEVYVGNGGDLDKHSFNHFNFNQNKRRILIRGTNSKATISYDENISESGKELKLYGESSLDLLA
ncbi:MAG: flagellar hook-length control protein FliK [Tissierellia bacterium]|nr:flagellar hook-length control protein FliK [Tissierellia bacterium]